MKKFLLSVLLLSATMWFATSCNDDDNNNDPGTLFEEVQANADLSTLEAAIVRANLQSALEASGAFTLFAPTNAAFTTLLGTLGYTSIDQVPVDVLTDILLNHLVNGENRSGDLNTGYVNTSLTYGGTTNEFLSLFVNTASGVKVNDATVTTADVDASNGVLHIIDKVLVPPTVVNHALNNPEFSTLVAALTRPDLGVDYVSILSGTGPFTVFAPTNAAFTSLLTELGLSSLNDIPASLLNSVLQYHVVQNANVRAEDLTNGQVVTTFEGGTFTIDLTGGAKIKDESNRTSNIILTNVQGDNGVVHAIDKVILPN